MSRRATQPTKGMNATKMRLVLITGLLCILSAMAAGFYFSYLYLKEVSTEVATIQAQAASSDANVQALMRTKEQLAENAQAVEKARQIVAESQSYRYQDQVVNDLTEYANRAGVSITSFTFQQQDEGAAQQAPPTTPAEGQTESMPPTAGTPAPATANKTTTVSVQLGSNLDYASLLHFIHLIEQNLTRMQISQLSISKGEDPATVAAQTLNIEVYLR